MIGHFLYLLYRIRLRFLRRKILWFVRKLEGGDCFSGTLRRIFQTYHGIDAGMYSYGCFVCGDIPSGTVIGRYCSFAEGVVIFNANHPLERKSLHPFFYNPHFGIVPNETIPRGRICIGHDVWIGRNAIVLPKVTEIGNGAVIGSGSVVTRNVPPYAIIGGNPAKIIRYRFPEEVQKKLEESRWWEESIETLRDRLEEFLKPVSGFELALHLPENRKRSVESENRDS